MASIDPIIVDPDDMYVNIKVFALYDTGGGSNASEIESDINAGVLDWGTQTGINNFNSTFRAQQLEKRLHFLIRQLVMFPSRLHFKYIKPNTNQTNTYCISIGNQLQ